MQATMGYRVALARRGRRLEWLTIGRNCLEGLVGIVAGAIAGSVSLLAFGIDSAIEVVSGTALLWRMSIDADLTRREQRERLTLRIVATCFMGLAVYIAVGAVLSLVNEELPEQKPGRGGVAPPPELAFTIDGKSFALFTRPCSTTSVC